MASLPPNSLVVVAAKEDSMMAHDIPFPFRQDPDFFYLTGLNEPGALMLMVILQNV